jgi:membrane protein YqaA with SNARE-associated domain
MELTQTWRQSGGDRLWPAHSNRRASLLSRVWACAVAAGILMSRHVRSGNRPGAQPPADDVSGTRRTREVGAGGRGAGEVVGMTWLYVVVFLSAIAVDVIPLIAPSAWIIAVFLLVKFHLHPWIVVPFCASGSTLGRYLMSLYIPRFAALFIKRHKTDELKFLGKKLSQSLWQSWLFVFIYSVTPLSTTALFTAAGVAKVKPSHMLPPFFCGKFLSYAVMIFTGLYAAANYKDLMLGAISPKGIVALVLGCAVLAGFLFLDWRALLQRKKFTFNFRIWK